MFLFAAFANVIAAKIKIPIEIFLLLASLLISLIPNRPIINLEPNTLLLLFLPPIIFSAAFFTSWRDFVANKRPISMLAVGLVLFVMCAVAVTLKLLIPNMNWTVCFLFGAIISPTDASSAVALVKKLNIPNRLITILEGESLVNDATALIAYRYALAALIAGTWSFWFAGLSFIFAAAGGVVLGIAIGYVSLRIYVWLSDPKSQSLFSLMIAYISYIIADWIGVSAIICVVAAGIYTSRNFPLLVPPESRHKTHTIWEVYIFSLNALVFILIGLQLPAVIKGLNQFSIQELVLYIVAINLVIILSRFVWVYPAAYIPRFLSKKLRERDPYPHWTILATLSWVGMRGVLSLILAMSLPHFLPSGEPFPYRSLIIFLTYSVIITTLLLPTFTLPSLAKIFHFKKENQHSREEALARIESIKAILQELNKALSQYPDIKPYIEHLSARYLTRLSVLESNLQELPFSKLDSVDQEIRRLTKKLLNTERSVLINLRREGSIHDEVFHLLEEELDLEDLRLKNPRI